VNKIYTYDPVKKEKMYFGYIEGKNFIREVDPERSFVRIYGGYSIRQDALDEIKRNCDNIIFKESNRKGYIISVGGFEKNCIPWNVGQGQQYVIPVRIMRKISVEQIELSFVNEISQKMEKLHEKI